MEIHVSENVLEVKNLNITLGDNKIIKDLSLHIDAGNFLTILGPNGTGKTVLVKALLGLLPETSGSVVWSKKTKLGYLPQGLTQSSVQGLPLSVHEFFGLKKVAQKDINRALKAVGLKPEIQNKKFGELSGGQFQRILLAWVLSTKPNVLILDEPTTGVDVGGEGTIYELLSKLKSENNLTIIMISHDLDVVHKYSSHALCLSQSHSNFGVPQEILTRKNLEKLYGSEMKTIEHEH